MTTKNHTFGRVEFNGVVKAFILRTELMELTPEAKKSAAKRFAL